MYILRSTMCISMMSVVKCSILAMYLVFHHYITPSYALRPAIYIAHHYNNNPYQTINGYSSSNSNSRTSLLYATATPNDISIELMKFADATSSSIDFMDTPAVSSSVFSISDVQNIALVLSGLCYLIYEKRPRGSARDDLIEVRKSVTIKNNNLGVFAKTFIPQGTLVGVYPGFVKSEEYVYEAKINEQAKKSARRYTWMTSNGDMIDPTNSNGLIDIELKYLGGLIKVSTTLARINEPPRMPGYDVNCYVKVTNKDVAIIAERDIFADEELFIDYGTAFDRSDYADQTDNDSANERKLFAATMLKEKEQMSRLQPVTMDDMSGGSPEDYLPIDQSTSNPDGFLNKLAKSRDSKYKNSGILTPEDGSRMFVEKGQGMFADKEDQELLDSIMGKSSAKAVTPSTSSGSSDRRAEVQSSLGDEQDFLGSLLGSSNLEAPPPTSTTTTTTTAFIPAATTSRPSTAASAPASTVLSVEEAADLQRRLDDMTDEQVKQVFEKMKASMGQRLQEQIAMKKSVSGKVNMPRAESVNPEVRKEYAKELAEIEDELAKLYENPLGVWKDIMKNPEKFLDDDDLLE